MRIMLWRSTRDALNFQRRSGHRRVPGKRSSRSGSAAYIVTLAAAILKILTATTLADLTLGWMMVKASALGLKFAPEVQSKYALPMDSKYALDQKHESWNPLWVFPKSRPIAANSTIADSVFVRCDHDSSYRPGNLNFVSGELATGYREEAVVNQPAAALEAGHSGAVHISRYESDSALGLCGLAAAADGSLNPKLEEAQELKACAQMVLNGLREIPDARAQRFLGKVSEAEMLCRGGQKSLQFRLTPWVDWSQYWGTGDMSSLPIGSSDIRPVSCSSSD